MPVKIKKKGKGTTKKKAKTQKRLLNAIEHNPDFKPRKKKKKSNQNYYHI